MINSQKQVRDEFDSENVWCYDLKWGYIVNFFLHWRGKVVLTLPKEIKEQSLYSMFWTFSINNVEPLRLCGAFSFSEEGQFSKGSLTNLLVSQEESADSRKHCGYHRLETGICEELRFYQPGYKACSISIYYQNCRRAPT